MRKMTDIPAAAPAPLFGMVFRVRVSVPAA